MCHPEVPAGTPLPDVPAEEVSIDVGAGDRMPGLLALPERTPAPAVLVVNDVFGRVAFYEHLAHRLAQAGFVALDPEFFFREGPLPEQTREAAMARRPKLNEKRTLADLGRALDWLKRRPDVDGKLGTIGFCMGGTFVLDLAAIRTDLAATVSYYGFPASSTPPPNDRPAPLEVADRMRGPILGHWGDQDTGVGMDNVEKLRAKLQARGTTHDFEVYPGLGHGFLKAYLEDESTPGYAQACASWTRTIAFYREAFGRVPAAA
jgi:carboxymethylenebutenolidase